MKKLYEMWDGFSADSSGLISTNADSDTVKKIWTRLYDEETEDREDEDDDDCPLDRLVKELNEKFPGTERVYVDDQIWA